MIKLKFLRLRNGLTQTELARMSGVSRVSINRIETGRCKYPRMETIVALALALKCNVSELV